MKIRKNTVVSADYTLTTEGGIRLTGSDSEGPMVYLHGHQQVLDALEDALEGAEPNETRYVTVSPEDGYGEHDPRLVFTAPRENLPDEPLREGMLLRTTEHDGRSFPLQVVEVSDDGAAVLDGNHPLAGKTLHFEIQVTDVRPASLEEVQRRRVTEN